MAQRQPRTDPQRRALIPAIPAELQGADGRPCKGREGRRHGFPASQERIERGRRENGLHARHPRRDQVTTDSRHARPVAENRWARQSIPTAPHPLGTSDIPSWWTEEGGRYPAIVLDWFHREVVGGSLKPRMTAELGTDALTMAGFRRRPAPGLRHHADRGSPYASPAFRDPLKEYGMVCSMSRQGNGGDHAPTESGFNRFKHGRGHGVRPASPAAMKATRFEDIEVVYHRKRQPSSLGYLSPVQFMEQWLGRQNQEKQVAGTPPLGRRITEGSSTSCRRSSRLFATNSSRNSSLPEPQ